MWTRILAVCTGVLMLTPGLWAGSEAAFNIVKYLAIILLCVAFAIENRRGRFGKVHPDSVVALAMVAGLAILILSDFLPGILPIWGWGILTASLALIVGALSKPAAATRH